MRRGRGALGCLAVGAAASVALSACGTGAPGVAVRRSSTNIEFGVSSTTQAAPAAIPQSVAPANLFGVGQIPAFQFATTTTYDFSSSAYGSTGTPPAAEQSACPQAPYGASPDKAVTPDVAKPPAIGTYKWQIIDSQPVSGTKLVLKSARYVSYIIDNVTKVVTTPNPVPGEQPTTSFDYDVESPGSKGGTVVTTYQVKESAPQVTESAGNVGQGQTVGTPDRGLSLVSVTDKNAAGAVTATFQPSAPILLLPLDVKAPQSFNSGGVDPANGGSFSNQAQVTGQTTRVNACGQLVDGWTVASTQTFTQPSTGTNVTATVDYAVAPQYGGIIISSASTPSGSAQTETDDIGQLQPDPPSGGAS